MTPHVHGMLEKHKRFAVGSAITFAALYAELGWFAHSLWRARDNGEAFVIIALGFILALIAYGGSFLPARPFTVAGVEAQGSLVLPQLMRQFTQGIAMIIIASALCFALYVYLVAGNLVATYTLLNNLYVITLAGVGLLHGLVTYVRYVALLYMVEQDHWVKVLTASGGIAAIILTATQFLIKLDIDWLYSMPIAQQGLVGLHVYGRDLYFFTLVLAVYLWHLHRIADH